MEHSFEINAKLATLNEYINAERSNRYAAAHIKKMATKTAHFSCIQLRGKVDETKQYCFHFIWHLKTKREDPDNICFAKKFILDGMVSAKVLSNDGAKNIKSFVDSFDYGSKEGVTVIFHEFEHYVGERP